MRFYYKILILTIISIFLISCGPIWCTYTVSYALTSNTTNTLDKIVYSDSTGGAITLVDVPLPWVYTFSRSESGNSLIIASIEGSIDSVNNPSGNTINVKIDVTGGDGEPINDMSTSVNKSINSLPNSDLHFNEEASDSFSDAW